jgi:hypothetical protein
MFQKEQPGRSDRIKVCEVAPALGDSAVIGDRGGLLIIDRAEIMPLAPDPGMLPSTWRSGIVA